MKGDGTSLRCYLLRIAVFVCAFFLSSSGLAADFTIRSFHSDIVVREDSAVAVEETLTVQFHEKRHGIFREIPFIYHDEYGGKVRTPLDILSVRDQAGNDLNFRTMRKGDVLHVRIGDPDRYVSGFRTYVISYTVRNAVLFLQDHDEFYWNVTGNYWSAPIDAASASVSVSSSHASKDLWASCYTGRYGSAEKSCSVDAARNAAVFKTSQRLDPREGLTIAFGWEKSLVSPPSALMKIIWMIDPASNWVFSLPLISLMIMTHLWRTTGRDPRVRESVTVRYEPPVCDGVPLIPGEVGALVDEKLDARDMTSTIVGLAVKGYIRIEEKKAEGIVFDSVDHYLLKLRDPDGQLTPFERVLMQSLFIEGRPGRMVSDLKNSFYRKLDLLKKTLYGELVAKKYFTVRPDYVRKKYFVTAAIVFCAVFFASYFLTASSPMKAVIAGLLTSLPILVFAGIMPAKTRLGSRIYYDILGFQEFMSRAEKDRLERLGDKELFSRYLPYAIALDVVDSWAKAFEGIYQEPPSWYSSPGGFHTFSAPGFSRSLNTATSTLASAMYSAPRGSGTGRSGGGGFSGGGFGGGGGGSW
jgi:uncharacterized membrane protein YgcG